MSKPNNLINLTKGKIIDAHKGFVDCWNFLMDFFKPSLHTHFKAGYDTNIVFSKGKDETEVTINVYYK